MAARGEGATPVIGFLSSASPDGFASRVSAFRRGLGKAGYVEGQNVAIEYRRAEGHYDQLRALADDLGRVCVPTVVICACEEGCALRLAHASSPKNTIDEQAVDLAMAWNKSFGAPSLYAM